MNKVIHRSSFLRFFFLLFFLVSFFISLSSFVGIYDEGISSYGAQMILHGGIPYRDFWTCYGPGQFYVLAFFFKILGPSLMVERLWIQIVFVLLLFISYLILDKFCPRRQVFIGTVMVALLLLNFSAIVVAGINPVFPVFLFSLASCYFLFIFFSDGQKRAAILSGLCVAAASLFRPEMGLAIFILEMVTIAIFYYLNKNKTNDGLFKGLENPKALPWFIFSYLIIVTPVLIFFLSCCKFSDLFFEFVTFPVGIYSKVRAVPWIWYLFSSGQGMAADQFIIVIFKSIFCFFPIAVIITSAAYLIGQLVHMRVKNEIPFLWYGCVFFTLLGFFFMKYSYTRTDFPHLFPLLLLSIILLFLLSSHFSNKKNLRFWLFGLISLFCFGLSLNLTEELQLIFKQTIGVYSVARARGISMGPLGQYLQEAVSYIQKNVPREEKIFVGSTLNDRVSISNVLFYFLSDRASATKYYEFQPGVTTTKEVQQTIVEDIDKARVRFIILDNSRWKDEPNDSHKSSGVHLLDQFIWHHFRVVKIFGNYVILHRNLYFKPL